MIDNLITHMYDGLPNDKKFCFACIVVFAGTAVCILSKNLPAHTNSIAA